MRYICSTSIPLDVGMVRGTIRLCASSFELRIVLAILVCKLCAFILFKLSDMLEGRVRLDSVVVLAFILVCIVFCRLSPEV